MTFDMAIRWPLEHHKSVVQGQQVLDLACHDGLSSLMLHDLGAVNVTGIDIRKELIAKACTMDRDGLRFICHDITDRDLLAKEVPGHNVVTAFGVLYHLFDHFKFMKHIMRDNIRHVIFETLYGPETSNPEMFWGVEDTSTVINGWDPDLPRIMHGTPNLSWLISAADIFNFGCDYIYRRYASTNWSKVIDHESNKRMIVRFFNRATISKDSFDIDHVWRWNDDNLFQEVM